MYRHLHLYVHKKSDDITKACSKHQKEMIKFYCHDHKELLCSVCVTLQHPVISCKVDYIPDISGLFINSDVYNNILRTIDKISDQYQKISEDTKKMTAKSEKSLTDALADIKKFRYEINQRLDELERQAEHSAKILQEEIDNNLKKVERNCEDAKTSLKVASDFIKHLNTSKQEDRLFMEMKLAEQMIEEYEDNVQQVTSYKVAEYTFQANDELSDLVVKKEIALGTISKNYLNKAKTSSPDQDEVRQIKFQTEINVKTLKDEQRCSISGMIDFTPDLLIITDYNNKAVKLVDIRGHSVVDQVQVDDSPLDITSITGTELAVTVPNEESIQFISTSSGKLKKKHIMKVNGNCYGISCYQDRLLVSYVKPAKLEILDTNGTFIRTVRTEKIFGFPLYVTVNNGLIWVSDWHLKAITKLNWQGKVVGSYGMNEPFGFTLSDKDTLYVCDKANETIEEVSGDCSKGGILLKDLKKPKAVCWCGETDMLYFSCKTGEAKYDNYLQVHKLS
ncbi:uncharacterized protein LOC132743608 [Ruditapes philippinarum]|uniref:uncharacterized protein LOC132743608 n=1 Tax=Ruditapes philippinarum TaxID=129788 RepID=UPI00295A9CC3|nr:uncharacterized protein LOC132743608 [Ruditapes philippinarum]